MKCIKCGAEIDKVRCCNCDFDLSKESFVYLIDSCFLNSEFRTLFEAHKNVQIDNNSIGLITDTVQLVYLSNIIKFINVIQQIINTQKQLSKTN